MQDVTDIADMSTEVPAAIAYGEPVVKIHLESFGEITLEAHTIKSAIRDINQCSAENVGMTIWRNGKAEMYIPHWAIDRITWIANAYPVIEDNKPAVIVPPKGTKFD